MVRTSAATLLLVATMNASAAALMSPSRRVVLERAALASTSWLLVAQADAATTEESSSLAGKYALARAGLASDGDIADLEAAAKAQLESHRLERLREAPAYLVAYFVALQFLMPASTRLRRTDDDSESDIKTNPLDQQHES